MVLCALVLGTVSMDGGFHFCIGTKTGSWAERVLGGGHLDRKEPKINAKGGHRQHGAGWALVGTRANVSAGIGLLCLPGCPVDPPPFLSFY